jgi:hypothetical protein
LRTFGDGGPEVFVIQACMQFSHFWGYRANNFFNSMRWAEDTSPKVRKSQEAVAMCAIATSGRISQTRNPPCLWIA